MSLHKYPKISKILNAYLYPSYIKEYSQMIWLPPKLIQWWYKFNMISLKEKILIVRISFSIFLYRVLDNWAHYQYIMVIPQGIQLEPMHTVMEKSKQISIHYWTSECYSIHHKTSIIVFINVLFQTAPLGYFTSSLKIVKWSQIISLQYLP